MPLIWRRSRDSRLWHVPCDVWRQEVAMKRSHKSERVVESNSCSLDPAQNAYDGEIRNLRVLASQPDLDQVVGRFLDVLAIDPQFHLASFPEKEPTLGKIAAAAISRLTGGQQMLNCQLLRCSGTDLVHGICQAGNYVVLALFFPNDKLGVLSAMFCPPGTPPWNARIRFQEVQAPGIWSNTQAPALLN